MKLILNPTTPLYVNEKEKNIRCGNFPQTGKVIYYEDDNFINFFNEMTNFIDVLELEDIASKKYNISKDDFDNIIEYLLNEQFIIDDSNFDKIYNSDIYNRQNAYFFMTTGHNKEIKNCQNKKILILGLGGIGSNVAEQLTRAGFKKFAIIDCDVVEKSNLIRQNSYYLDDVGLFKTDALEKRLKKINKEVIIEKYNCKISCEDDISKIICDCDLVVSTLDKPYRKIRRIVNSVCVDNNKPVLFAGFAEYVGMVGPFIIPNKTACLECIDREMPEIPLENIKITPSFGPLCNIISSIVVSEVINYFLENNSGNLIGTTLMFNMLNYKTNKIKWKKNKKCRKCGEINDNK